MPEPATHIVPTGPLFLGWLNSADVVGTCDTCSDNGPDQAIGVARFRFGETVVQLCGTCLRRLSNQLRRALG